MEKECVQTQIFEIIFRDHSDKLNEKSIHQRLK